MNKKLIIATYILLGIVIITQFIHGQMKSYLIESQKSVMSQMTVIIKDAAQKGYVAEQN